MRPPNRGSLRIGKLQDVKMPRASLELHKRTGRHSLVCKAFAACHKAANSLLLDSTLDSDLKYEASTPARPVGTKMGLSSNSA